MKEIVLNYCSKFSNIDLSHIENCIENKNLIENGIYNCLNGCPSTYGLDNYIGLCEIDKSLVVTNEVCESCWKKALNI